MKRIIVATDFSAEADSALIYAASAAMEQQYELIIFTLVNTSFHTLNAGLSTSSFDEVSNRYADKVNELAASIANVYGISVKQCITSGDFMEELQKSIIENNADLLVMGMAGKSLEQNLLGNTTTAAIHRLNIPVLAVPLGIKYTGLKKMLFGCDITRGIHAEVLAAVGNIAAEFGAEVEVFHVREKIEELDTQTQAAFENIDRALSTVPHHYKDIQSAQVIAAIEDELVAIKADLLIMVPYRYGFWQSIGHRSKTSIMASGIGIPLLSIPLH